MARADRGQKAGDRLAVERDPTPQQESEVFENDDERRARLKHERELDLIHEHKGFLGGLTGSTDTRVNTGVAVLLILTGLLLFTETLLLAGAPHLETVPDGIIKVMLAVVGFVLGSVAPRSK